MQYCEEIHSMKFMTVYKWTEKTFRAAIKRWLSLFDGSAPQAVRDALQKVKTLSVTSAPQDHMSFQLWEAAEADLPDIFAITLYLQEVMSCDTHMVMDGDDFNRTWDKLDLLDSVPKPEW